MSELSDKWIHGSRWRLFLLTFIGIPLATLAFIGAMWCASMILVKIFEYGRWYGLATVWFVMCLTIARTRTAPEKTQDQPSSIRKP